MLPLIEQILLQQILKKEKTGGMSEHALVSLTVISAISDRQLSPDEGMHAHRVLIKDLREAHKCKQPAFSI